MSSISESTSTGRLRGQTTSAVPDERATSTMKTTPTRPRGKSSPNPPSLSKSFSGAARLLTPMSMSKSKRGGSEVPGLPPSASKDSLFSDEEASEGEGLGRMKESSNAKVLGKDKEVGKDKEPGKSRKDARIRQSLDKFLERAPGLTKKALVLSEDLLKLVPIPGIAEVAHTIIAIWGEIQRVNDNWGSCYRLAEACASFLISLREHLADLDEKTAQSVAVPMQKVVSMFIEVQQFLITMNANSRVQLYMDRDKNARRIDRFTTDLHTANISFQNSIQFIILSHVAGLSRVCSSTPAMTPSSSRQSALGTLDASLAQYRTKGLAPSPPSDSARPSSATQPPSAQPDTHAAPISFAAAGWASGALPPAVQDAAWRHTSVTLTTAQIARIMARLRTPVSEGGAGYTEEQICRELAELRLFMARAGNIQGRLLALLEGEGSQIPGALRALQLL
ncbi:hypothetical protein BD626DRAFT_515843 [Schizophyllum amplum]|uniref:Uncharacterized protein n=1 Tax=Schizophyllum amplum TaxID=97359 RepID=A0A550BXE4_9AGAR|nr:hypothetical protein BD626DRAFT_515843 [Auriculariopsis ampla]